MPALVYHPDDRLRTVAEPVESITPEIRTLAEQMIHTMRGAQGIGLAGPQVGRNLRLFVVGIGEAQPIAFINPRIVAVSPDEGPYEEGCLSIPGVYADVNRPLAVSVEAFAPDGAPFRLDAEGVLARVIQHEYDHLEGVLFIDYLTRRRRERILKSYAPPEA